MTKIYILTEYFPPSFAATGQLLEELSDSLKDQFDIEVVTCKRNSDTEYKKKDYRVKRLFSFGLNKNNKIGRAINGILFFVLSFFHILFKSKRSILLIVSNPPFLSFLGYIFHKLRRQRFVYLIHDQYPEIAVNLGYLKSDSFLVRLWKKINKRIFSTSAYTVVLGERMGEKIKEFYPDIKNRFNLVVIPNWADETKLFPLDNKNELKDRFGLKNKFVIQYSGNIGLFHNTEKIIELAQLLKNNNEIVFQIIGQGGKKEALIKLVDEKKLDNVKFFDYVKKEDLNESLNGCDLSLITLSDKAYNLAVPSKFQGIIACGIPIIGIMDENNDVGEEIAKSSLGYISTNVEELANKILFLYRNRNILSFFSKNAIELFKRKYTLSVVSGIYKKLFNELEVSMVDLHCHSNYSDGSLSPRELISMAKESGINYLAITDHDTVDGMDEKIEIANEYNINMVTGVEISCDFRDGELHILGLFFDYKNHDLNDFLLKLKKFRTERNFRMVEKFRSIGVEIDMDEFLSGGKKIEAVGKPNFAKYLLDKGIVKNFKEAFNKYLKDGGPADVKKQRVTEKEAIAQIHNAGGIAILAHPDQTKIRNYSEFEEFIKDMKEKGLDGIEVYYTNYTKKEIKFYKKIADKYNLLISGGSDYHGGNKAYGIRLGFYGKNKRIPPEIIRNMKNYLRR